MDAHPPPEPDRPPTSVSGGLPPHCRLEAAPDLRTLAGGRILLGGAPLTIMRLSAAGATMVRRWFRGEAVGSGTGAQALARRLLRSGMAHPRWDDVSPEGAVTGDGAGQAHRTPGDLTIIIPVKDDQEGLNRTLDALLRPNESGENGSRPAAGENEPAVIVIDDGSRRPVTCDHESVTVRRNETATGPGSARQRALIATETPFVLFLDAGVVIDRGRLRDLLDQFVDPELVAVAPRVASAPADHLVGRYDRLRSPLDLGPSESLVGPGRLVPYVPTACLLARRGPVAAAGGFDTDLRYGEDVDLVWRLSLLGDIRYHPAVTVTHPPRDSVSEMADQRRSYGSAAAPLAARHGGAVAPAKMSAWSLLVAVLALAGHPFKALLVWAWTAAALRPKIAPLPNVTVEAALLTGRGHWYAGLSLLTAVARTWGPVVLGAAVLLPSQRGRIGRLIAAALARRVLDGPRRGSPAVIDLALGAVDDISYCAGVWEGVYRTRSATALLPAMTSWPKAGATD